jgi:hypothetical protein
MYKMNLTPSKIRSQINERAWLFTVTINGIGMLYLDGMEEVHSSRHGERRHSLSGRLVDAVEHIVCNSVQIKVSKLSRELLLATHSTL